VPSNGLRFSCERLKPPSNARPPRPVCSNCAAPVSCKRVLGARFMLSRLLPRLDHTRRSPATQPAHGARSRRGRAEKAGDGPAAARLAEEPERGDSPRARPRFLTAAPNGLRLSGTRKRVRCSRGFGGFISFQPRPALKKVLLAPTPCNGCRERREFRRELYLGERSRCHRPGKGRRPGRTEVGRSSWPRCRRRCSRTHRKCTSLAQRSASGRHAETCCRKSTAKEEEMRLRHR